MKIEKAIEILEENIFNLKLPNDMYLEDAIRLGSEALKILLQCRKETCSGASFPIPGETKE